MNVLMFSRTLKIVGVLLIACAYLFLAKLSIPFALIMAWVGISLIVTTSFIKTSNVEAPKPKTKKVTEVSARRSNREAEA